MNGILTSLLGALKDPQFYRDMAGNAAGILGTPLPTEREGLAALSPDKRFQDPEIQVHRMMTDPSTQGLLASSWDEKMNQLGILGLTVYHGSPHKFDKFDSSKIGTGEGAQAYGHGLYLAENPGTAASYQRNLGISDPLERMVSHMYENRLIAGKTKAQALKQTAEWARKHPQLGERYAGRVKDIVSQGNLYKVDLPDDQIAKMLDWDKPLSQQPESVRKILTDLGVPSKKVFTNREMTGAEALDYLTASHAGSSLDATIGKPKIAEQLRQLGIPGIKYLDAGSRTAGEGSRNFVVFPGNEVILKILGRE